MNPLFDQRLCKRPRRLETYRIIPKSRRFPRWWEAERFVNDVVRARIGRPPWFASGGPRNGEFWKAIKRQRLYADVAKYHKQAIMSEDYPINP